MKRKILLYTKSKIKNLNIFRIYNPKILIMKLGINKGNFDEKKEIIIKLYFYLFWNKIFKCF